MYFFQFVCVCVCYFVRPNVSFPEADVVVDALKCISGETERALKDRLHCHQWYFNLYLLVYLFIYLKNKEQGWGA